MDVEDGGWLVFQYRFNGSVQFNEFYWQSYKNGFGSVHGEHWLGNDLLHLLTTSTENEVYVHAGRFNGGQNFSRYDYFRIESERTKYRAHIGQLVVEHLFFSTWRTPNKTRKMKKVNSSMSNCGTSV